MLLKQARLHNTGRASGCLGVSANAYLELHQLHELIIEYSLVHSLPQKLLNLTVDSCQGVHLKDPSSGHPVQELGLGIVGPSSGPIM